LDGGSPPTTFIVINFISSLPAPVAGFPFGPAILYNKKY